MSFDIFCRVVDNFGDIGVCWRLARQLAAHATTDRVRLWVDDLHSFHRIAAAIDPQLATQTLASIDIVHWSAAAPSLRPHPIVIEAFACDPPPAFIEAMRQQHSLWINLEYLSAESWVESCHALPSVQDHGLKKYFFFPGFTQATGGLLRETNLLQERDQWLSQTEQRWQLLHDLGLDTHALQALRLGARQVLLFCYPDAPVPGLLASLAKDPRPTVVLAPAGVYPGLDSGATDHVHLCRIPFTDQPAFDRLLWSSDLNFVRGEDSLVRALWAGKPLIWQIYHQDEDAHLVKLQAWLKRSGYPANIAQLMTHWNTGQAKTFSSEFTLALQPDRWHSWQASSQKFTAALTAQDDLATNLITFCTQMQRTG
ncbi:MAG: elongation factor P maturation arginine rhamnosyltransferase EarP [Burkholderiaceae bacterium]|nr:elongation factor P maturation arginine rhamnosyltransferase EarP [Burkholderiaceae bacterium]